MSETTRPPGKLPIVAVNNGSTALQLLRLLHDPKDALGAGQGLLGRLNIPSDSVYNLCRQQVSRSTNRCITCLNILL